MIPVIDVGRRIAEKKDRGELAFSFEADGSLLDIPYVSFSSPVEAKLRYEIFGDDTVSVMGEISFSLRGACSRCLRETERRYTGEVDAFFVPGKGDGVDYGYRGTVVLEECMRDSLLSALPVRLECGESCEMPDFGNEWKKSE